LTCAMLDSAALSEKRFDFHDSHSRDVICSIIYVQYFNFFIFNKN